jgi:cysteinyl-tRNA synthetase
MDLGPEELGAAAKAWERFGALERAALAAGVTGNGAPIDDAPLDDALVAEFRTAMDDDFNTPAAMAAIFDGVRDANRAISDGELTRAASLVATVRELTGVLGLDPSAGPVDTDDDADIDALVRSRDDKRAARDFAGADAIRDELSARGVKLEDTAGGTVWHR